MDTRKPLIVIVGPTASGKSGLAIDIAKQFDGEIICADSRTVYKSMDIGTAKPTKSDQRRIKHHLLDVVNPNELFNVAQFKQLAKKAIALVQARGKVPILVGGSGLYINAIIFDYRFGPPADPVARERLNKLTLEELQVMCNQKDIVLPVNYLNKRHLIRAIELSGLPQQKNKLIDNALVVGLTIERDILKHRIQKRTSEMFKEGVLQEAKRLGRMYGWDIEPMKGNIYRVCKRIAEGELALDQAQPEVNRLDAHLAKRQMTWFRANKYVHWGDAAQLKSEIKDFLTKYNMPRAPK